MAVEMICKLMAWIINTRNWESSCEISIISTASESADAPDKSEDINTTKLRMVITAKKTAINTTSTKNPKYL
jgi:hypothetical protein